MKKVKIKNNYFLIIYRLKQHSKNRFKMKMKILKKLSFSMLIPKKLINYPIKTMNKKPNTK